MTADTTTLTLSPGIRSRLGALRWRIRAYVWLEGLSLLVIWIAMMFWIGFAIDYGPVKLGFYLPNVLGLDEMTRLERVLLLGFVGAVAGWILYRWILRRAFVQMADHSMAVLLERQFGSEHDSLLTAVEMAETPLHATDFNADMLSHASEAAAAQLGHVRLRRVFRHFPLWRNVILALLMAGSVVAFSVLAKPTFSIAANRLYALADQPYARRAMIEVAGVEVSQTMWVPAGVSGLEVINDLSDGEEGPDDTAAAAAGASDVAEPDELAGAYVKRRIPRLKPFVDGVVRVARGSSPRLIAHAKLDREVVPESCKLHYWTDEGYNDLAPMQRPRGSDGDGVRRFVYRNRPLKGIRSDVRCEVIGGDHRVGNLRIEVVDSPSVVSAQLRCERPAYTELLPQDIDFAPGTQLPIGTRITIVATANKRLARVQVYDAGSARMTYLSGDQLDGPTFRHEIERLDGDLALEIMLEDTDGVSGDEPYRMAIAALEDQKPDVKVVLRGIGTSVTPDARLPAVGVIGDDYGVAEAGFELQTNNDPELERFPIALPRNGQVDAAIDLREARARDEDPLALKPGDKIVVAVRASDKCDLGDGPNLGSSERYQLDVVTADQLLARLDAREIAQRQRFEQIIEELTKTRGDLVRVEVDLKASDEADPGAEPDDAVAEADSTADAGAEPDDVPLDDQTVRLRARSLRLLMVQRAVLQVDKSTQEMAGVAATFDDIREELINNRVDTEERKIRLKEQISEPIKQIAGPMCGELARRLSVLEPELEKPAGPQAATEAVEQLDLVLLEMDNVLTRMLDLESYNELVEIVRELIKEQDGLLEDTKKEHKKRIFGDLLQ